MPVFIQLSKTQKKFHDKMAATARRMNKHDEEYPSAMVKAAQARAREQELQNLAAMQARDAATEQTIETVRTNNALRAQEKYRKVEVQP